MGTTSAKESRTRIWFSGVMDASVCLHGEARDRFRSDAASRPETAGGRGERSSTCPRGKRMRTALIAQLSGSLSWIGSMNPFSILEKWFISNAAISNRERALTENGAVMEFSDQSTFLAVARCGGITRAAIDLGTVQSNVTKRIRALEAEIGSPLFERHSRGMTLSAAGRRLMPYVERLTALSREAVVAARDDGVPKGPLAIGSMETTAAVRLPKLL